MVTLSVLPVSVVVFQVFQLRLVYSLDMPDPMVIFHTVWMLYNNNYYDNYNKHTNRGCYFCFCHKALVANKQLIHVQTVQLVQSV